MGWSIHYKMSNAAKFGKDNHSPADIVRDQRDTSKPASVMATTVGLLDEAYARSLLLDSAAGVDRAAGQLLDQSRSTQSEVLSRDEAHRALYEATRDLKAAAEHEVRQQRLVTPTLALFMDGRHFAPVRRIGTICRGR